MKSIAIWLKPLGENRTNINEAELHFNLWKLPHGADGYIRFLDIGIKLENTEGIGEIKLYFPFLIEKESFEDIVAKFISRADLLSAIFNENYKVTSLSTSKFHKISDANDVFAFNIYQTSPNDYILEKKYDGTILRLHCPNTTERIYFRFRIKGDYLESLSTIQKPSNSLIQSAFSKTEMMDFRVNEARDLNHNLLEEMNNEIVLKIKKCHFFFICSFNEDVFGSHKPYLNCRNLENYRWLYYVGEHLLNSKHVFIAYHWKEENRSDLNFLIKTKFEKNNWKTIFVYISILFGLTVIFNLISNWLFDIFKGIF